VGASVHVSTIETWEDVAAWWWDLSEYKMIPHEEVIWAASVATAGALTEEEWISSLYEFMVYYIRYVGLRLYDTGYEPRPAWETIRTQYGDCKDQAVMLVAMLRQLGFEAYPMLMSMEPGYSVNWDLPPAPYPHFDHAIVAVLRESGEWQYLDPTCGLCTAESVGVLLRDTNGLLVAPDPELLDVRVDLPPSDPTENTVKCTLFGLLRPDELIVVTSDVETTGVNDIQYRAELLSSESYGAQNLFTTWIHEAMPQASVRGFTHSDPYDLEEPVSYSLVYEKREAIRWITGNLGLLALADGPLLPEDYSDVEFYAERQYPYLLTPIRVELDAAIDVGEFVVSELPEDVRVENRVGSFVASSAMDGSTIVYERAFQIDVSEVAPQDYPLYRELVLAMLDAQEAVAVLER
jgi:hypothetical protein